MEKNYETNPAKAKYIKENLIKKYPEIFEKYEIDDLSETQVCNLAEFLLKEHPEKYEKNRGIYETDENLRKIFVVIQKEKESAVLINTNDEGKVPEGEFGTYDLAKNQFKTASQIRDELAKGLGISALEIEKQDEIINSLFKDLDDMDKLATMDLNKIIYEKKPEIKKIIDEKINESNNENGFTEDDRKKIEKENEKQTENKEQDEEVVIAEEDEEKSNAKKVPEDVEKACVRLGLTKIKGFYYVNATELGNKVDDIAVNKNGGRVLIIEAPNSSNITGPDRYYGMQDNRMVLYGTADKEMEEITERGNMPPVDGKMISPLKKDNPTYVEYSGDGIDIKERIEEKFDLSVQEMEEYKKEQEELLNEYANETNKIVEDLTLSPEEKIAKLEQVNSVYFNENVQLGQKYGINYSDIKAVNNEQKGKTEEAQEDVEQENGDDEYDDRGKILPPGQRRRGE